MKPGPKTIEVKYAGARVLIAQRSNGWWEIRWREAGKGRHTTRVKKVDAEEFARKKVRELSAGQGGRMMTTEDAHLVQRLRTLAGTRSPFAVLDQLESAAKRLGGWEAVPRALQFYEDSGMSRVERSSMQEARNRFIDHYDERDKETTATLRKELDLFCKSHGTLVVCDLSCEMLAAWAGRPKACGGAVEARTFNNRLNVWRTFLNRCRLWNLWPKGEKHPGEMVDRRREADRVPEILTLTQVQELLKAVLEEAPQLLNYLVIGAWLGLRPAEIQRLQVSAWDWERGYVDIGSDVAAKVMQQRFVPIPTNVRSLLGGQIHDPRQRTKTRGRREAMCCGSDDAAFLSKLARRKQIVSEWTPDVLRHSYISYRLAQGNGRGKVAEWAGNSESEIRKKYRRPLRAEEGDAWFAVGVR